MAAELFVINYQVSKGEALSQRVLELDPVNWLQFLALSTSIRIAISFIIKHKELNYGHMRIHKTQFAAFFPKTESHINELHLSFLLRWGALRYRSAASFVGPWSILSCCRGHPDLATDAAARWLLVDDLWARSWHWTVVERVMDVALRVAMRLSSV